MLIRLILCVLLFGVVVSSTSPLIKPMKNEVITCMAQNVFYEAGNQSIQGKIAVAYVTYNRTLNKRFPNDICSVVFQKNQFSWTSNKKRERINVNDWRWVESIYVANNFKLYKDPTHGALFFHEKNIFPKWGMPIQLAASIGNHLFYKFKN